MRIAARLEPFGRFLRALGCAHRDRGLLRQAKGVEDEAYAIVKKEWMAGRTTAEEVANYMNTQANTMRHTGNPERAVEKFKYALSFFRLDPATGDEHPYVTAITRNLAYTLLQLGRFDEAEREFGKSLAIREKYYPKGHLKRLETTFALAQTYKYQDRNVEAQELLDTLPNASLSILEGNFNGEVLPCFQLDPSKITVYEFLESLKAKNTAAPKHMSDVLPENEIKSNGAIYKFAFPTKSIPPRGSDLCPCGSGIQFFRCHKKDFQRALKANLTQRG